MVTSDDVKRASVALRLVPKDEPEVDAQSDCLVTLHEAVTDVTQEIAKGGGPELVIVICAHNSPYGLSTSWYSPHGSSLLEKIGLLHMVASDLARIGEPDDGPQSAA